MRSAWLSHVGLCASARGCERSERASHGGRTTIESKTLSDITVIALQNKLNTTCFPSFGEAFVDHANVVFGPLPTTTNGDAVQLHVPVDLFIVIRSAVLAAPNGLPAGATSPAGRVTLYLEARANGDDTAQLTSRFSDRVEVREIGTLGLTLLDSQTLNREVPTHAMQSLRTTEAAPPPDPVTSEWLPDIRTLLPVPGFEGAPIAIALMQDGAALVLDLKNSERPRVAGTFIGPIRTCTPPATGRWRAPVTSARSVA